MFVSYSPSMHRVLVVGSGIQGLNKAIKHHLLGHQVVILEKREQIGGRGSGDSIRGFSLENGPHFLLKNGPLYKLIKKVGGIKPMYRPLLPQKIQIAGVGKLLPMDSPSALLQYKKGLDKVREDAAIFVSSWGLDLPLRKKALFKQGLLVPRTGWSGLIGRIASAIDEAGIPIQTNCVVEEVIEGGVRLRDGRKVEADSVFMCTGPISERKASTIDLVLSSKPLLGLHGVIESETAIFDLAAINNARMQEGSHLSCISFNGGVSHLENFLDKRASGWRDHILAIKRNEAITITDNGGLSDARI